MNLIFVVVGLVSVIGGLGLTFVALTTAELNLLLTGSTALMGLAAAGSGIGMLTRHPLVFPMTWIAAAMWILALFADSHIGITEMCFRRDSRPLWATLVVANYWALCIILVMCPAGRDYLYGDSD